MQWTSDRDACGIGFVARMDGVASPDILDRVLGGLACVKHRGALAADARSSDGAGVLLPLSESVVQSLAFVDGPSVPTGSRTGVAMIFCDPPGTDAYDQITEIVENACGRYGLSVLGWRDVPTEPQVLGDFARKTMPHVAQLFFSVSESMDANEAECRAFVARKAAEHASRGADRRFYVASMSFRLVNYKSLAAGDALRSFYPDLASEHLAVPFGIFHMRFSTNTAPSWERAQPFRLLCHNGEINTLGGNERQMSARGRLGWGQHGVGTFEGTIGDEETIRPVLDPDNSDSGKLDAAVELLLRAGRTIDHSLAMLIPEAWQAVAEIPPAVRDFYRYHACLMEPWDGPAAVISSDGRKVVACLDRNGLRPLRWAVTDDGLAVACSEAGAIDLTGAGKVRRGRLGPGQMLVVDPDVGFLVDHDVKARLSAAAPYGRWVAEGIIELDSGDPIQQTRPDLVHHQVVHGWTTEDVAMIVKSMATDAKEPTFAMGDDTPVPLFGSIFRPIHHSFKQGFAQVTNPPIDHLRERMVMSLRSRLGVRDLLLSQRPQATHVVELPSFFCKPSILGYLTNPNEAPFSPVTIDARFQTEHGPLGLRAAVERIATAADEAVAAGAVLVILRDHVEAPDEVPVPMLLAVGACHHRLVTSGRRSAANIICDTDEVRDTHHLATLLGYGADLICPRLALETATKMADDLMLGEHVTGSAAQEHLQTAMEDGVLKIMSKMGIATLDSYRGAQIFEAIGIGHDVIDVCFVGTPSIIGGADWAMLGEALLARHADATTRSRPPSVGLVRHRKGGEYHAYNPEVTEALHEAVGIESDRRNRRQARSTSWSWAGSGKLSVPEPGAEPEAAAGAKLSVPEPGAEPEAAAGAKLPEPGAEPEAAAGAKLPVPEPGAEPEAAAGAKLPEPGAAAPASVLHQAVANGDPAGYRRFAAIVNGRPPTEVHDLLEPIAAPSPVPLNEVEPVDAICRRFVTGAMSHGALSKEAHETLAVAMNMIGGRSNCGEGGEARDRFRSRGTSHDRNCRTKQIASGRFGVTPEYCVHADELQIKMAQGSKPGEGGQIPGHKVTEEIAALRRTQSGVTLISPPPHHDIYSIEDLAQLIFDLKQVNGDASINVKLVALAGVGQIAAGVVKGLAESVHISGCTGGTGASSLSSIKHAGMPWSLGLAETQRMLMENGLRARVMLSADGGFKTGRDVIVAALLGADEYGFGTAALVAEGCQMVRACHRDTCPTGIATQREHLRRRFVGTAQGVAQYMRWVAEEVREWLSLLGLRCLDEAVGRVDLLRQRSTGCPNIDCVDLGLLIRDLPAGPCRYMGREDIQRARSLLGDRLLADAFRSIWEGDDLELHYEITNRDRSVGAALGGAIALEFGESWPPGQVTVTFEGTAGQSFGAFLTKGIDLRLTGDANDYVGKAMGGGRIVVRPPLDDAGSPFLIGNTVLYGATGGELFCAGSAGERFAVRNSGATAVVEGVGQHCAEYMTGGTLVVLGEVGLNLGAGMTGGLVFVHDPAGKLLGRVNGALVEAIKPHSADMEAVRQLVERHEVLTSSRRASDLLRDWARAVNEFWMVAPRGAIQRFESTPAHTVEAAS